MCIRDRFNTIAKQLELQSLGKHTIDQSVSTEEYDQFCKEYIFDMLKDNEETFGEAFCKRFNIHNYVLSTLQSRESADKHIKKFYINDTRSNRKLH